MASVKKPYTEPNAQATISAAKKKSVFYTLPPDSRTPVRFLPPTEDNGAAFTVIHNHFNLKNQNGEDISYGCLKHEKGEPCPACIVAEHLFGTGADIDNKLARKIMAKPRYYGQVYVKGMEDEGPKLMGYAPSMATKLGEIGATLADSSLPQYNSIKGGQMVTLVRKGSGLQTEYDAMITGQTVDLGKVRSEWEEEIIGDVYSRVKPRFGTTEEMVDSLTKTYGGEVDIASIVGA